MKEREIESTISCIRIVWACLVYVGIVKLGIIIGDKLFLYFAIFFGIINLLIFIINETTQKEAKQK